MLVLLNGKKTRIYHKDKKGKLVTKGFICPFCNTDLAAAIIDCCLINQKQTEVVIKI